MTNGLNLGPGVTRNPDGSFSVNGKPLPTGRVNPSMTYSPVNTTVPTFGVPGVGTPGAPSAPGGGPTNNFGPDLSDPTGKNDPGFLDWAKKNAKAIAKFVALGLTAYQAYKVSKATEDPGSNSDSGSPQNVNELTAAMADIAKQQAGRATELFNSATPLRTAGTAALQQRLAAGPRAVPDLSGVVDNANPFRKNFRMPSALDAAAAVTAPAPPPATTPGAPGAPATPLPDGDVTKDRIKRAWGSLR